MALKLAKESEMWNLYNQITEHSKTAEAHSMIVILPPVHNSESLLLRDLRKLLHEPIHSDLSFTIENQEIFGHKVPFYLNQETMWNILFFFLFFSFSQPSNF